MSRLKPLLLAAALYAAPVQAEDLPRITLAQIQDGFTGKGRVRHYLYSYEGDLVDSKFEGEGKIEMKEGIVFEGTWREGNPQTGVFLYKGEEYNVNFEKQKAPISIDGNDLVLKWHLSNFILNPSGQDTSVVQENIRVRVGEIVEEEEDTIKKRVSDPSNVFQEYMRVGEEMRNLHQRGAWAGVERKFRQLEEMEEKGGFAIEDTFYEGEVILGAYDYYVGAMSSRQKGDSSEMELRLKMAELNDPNMEKVNDALKEIEANYGHVRLTFPMGYHGPLLTRDALPFNPDHVKSIEFAQAQLLMIGEHIGLLPYGTYTFGTQEFTLSPENPAVGINLKK